METCVLDVPSLWPLPCDQLHHPPPRSSPATVMDALNHTTSYLRRFLQYTSCRVFVSVRSMMSYPSSCNAWSACGRKKPRPSWILYVPRLNPGVRSGQRRGGGGTVRIRSYPWRSGHVKQIGTFMDLAVPTCGTKKTTIVRHILIRRTYRRVRYLCGENMELRNEAPE